MGLETNKLSSLWKDEALVVINVAVIYSFQVLSLMHEVHMSISGPQALFVVVLRISLSCHVEK